MQEILRKCHQYRYMLCTFNRIFNSYDFVWATNLSLCTKFFWDPDTFSMAKHQVTLSRKSSERNKNFFTIHSLKQHDVIFFGLFFVLYLYVASFVKFASVRLSPESYPTTYSSLNAISCWSFKNLFKGMLYSTPTKIQVRINIENLWTCSMRLNRS